MVPKPFHIFGYASRANRVPKRPIFRADEYQPVPHHVPNSLKDTNTFYYVTTQGSEITRIVAEYAKLCKFARKLHDYVRT